MGKQGCDVGLYKRERNRIKGHYKRQDCYKGQAPGLALVPAPILRH